MLAKNSYITILLVCVTTIVLLYMRSKLSIKPGYVVSISKSNVKWLILKSIKQVPLYSNSSSEKISIVVVDNDKKLLTDPRTVVFLDVAQQAQHGFRSKHPKTLAYLYAIEHGARFISEYRAPNIFDDNVQHFAFRRERSPFVNIHATFTGNFRQYSPGLPLNETKDITEDGWSSIRLVDRDQESIRPLIQHELALDASSIFHSHPPVAVEPFTFAPFSSEGTIFAYDAFWSLLLPRSKSDHWRSWWVERLLCDINGHVVFASSSFLQNRTAKTDLQKTIKEDPDVGMLVRFLISWTSSKPTLSERIEDLFRDMTAKKFCDTGDVDDVLDWLADLKQINYTFPPIKDSASQQKSSTKTRQRRIAVCLTGLIECTDEAWKPTFAALRTHLTGDMDVFMYLSSTQPLVDQLATVPLHMSIAEALRYPNFTVKILFENKPTLNPQFPPNCTTDASVNQPKHKVPRYYQQLFGLSNCFAIVRDYEKKHNIKYEIMVRARVDITFGRIPPTFERPHPYNITNTTIIPPHRFNSKFDDGFAIGPIDQIEIYMNRWFSFRTCLSRDLHPERYLDFYLNYRKVNPVLDRDTLVVPIPHSPQHCH